MWRRRRVFEAIGSDDVTVAGALVAASWIVFCLAIILLGALRLTGSSPSLWLQSVAYLGLMIGISLPHGGFEHVENLRGRGDRFRVRYLLAYVLLVALSFALFLRAPVAGLGLALAVTAAKGGHGGLHVLHTVAGTPHLRTRVQRALAVAVRGGAVVVVPLLFHEGVYYMVASYMVSVVEPGAITAIEWLFAPAVQLALGLAFAALLGAHLLVGYARAGAGHAWRVDAAETLLLVAFFAVVPPILAIGLYFPCWYATRQVARLSGADAPRRLADARVTTALVRFGRRAALPWIGALAILAGMAALVPNPPEGAVTWMAFYSVFVAVIAVPHVAVGGWLDRKQGIWAVGS